MAACSRTRSWSRRRPGTPSSRRWCRCARRTGGRATSRESIALRMEVVNAPPFIWTAERYMRFAENDIFVAEDRVELLNGIIVQLPRATPHHAYASTGL